METEHFSVNVPVTVNIVKRILSDGTPWFYASSQCGNTNSYSKEDCIRIMKDKVRRQCGLK